MMNIYTTSNIDKKVFEYISFFGHWINELQTISNKMRRNKRLNELM